MSEVLLINTSFSTKNIKSFDKLTPPLGLLAIASSLVRSGFDVALIDPQLEGDFMEKIEQKVCEKPLFIGMTTFVGTNIINALEISRYINKLSPQTPIVWGGPLATSSPETCLNEAPVSNIVMGMGEETVVKMAKALEQGGDVSSLPHISSNNSSSVKVKDVYYFNGDLDDLYYSELKLWEEGIKKMGSIPILSSRGCPKNCSFCYNNQFTGRKKWFARSCRNVIDEMDYWAKYFNMNKFYFVDDNFLINSKRACCILGKAIEKNYKITQVIGNLNDFKPEVLEFIFGYINHVGFSIESASLKIQKLLNKVLNLEKVYDLIQCFTEKGIENITTNFMFGLPTETDDDILANIEMALKIRNFNDKVRIIPYIYTPQPKDDIIQKFDFYKKINFSIEVLSTIDLAPNRSNILSHEIRPWMSKEDIEFYLDIVLVWFYHFDHEVRNSQDIDIEMILKKNARVFKFFKDVPMPKV